MRAPAASTSSPGSRTRRASPAAARRAVATPALLAALGAYALVVVSYLQLRVSNDGLTYLAFLRRLLGETSDPAYAYQFGVALWNAPFHLAGRAASSVGADLGGVPADEAAIAVASAVAVALVVPLGTLLLARARLDLGRHAPWTVLLLVAGSPLVSSVLFTPWDTHSADALGAFGLALLLARLVATPAPPRSLLVATGVLLGWLVTVRYANAVLVVGPLGLLAFRRDVRSGAWLGASAAATVGALFLLPVLRGIPFGVSADPRIQGQPGGVGGEIELDLLAPLKMLLTPHRGLFVWTPLTLVALAGVVLLWRRAHVSRPLLAVLGANAAALLAVHVLWGRYWDGGFGFSQRFLIGTLPLLLLGLAELLRRRPRATLAVAAACLAWTAFLALYHAYGYEGIDADDGVQDVLALYRDGEETPGEFARVKVAAPLRDRWTEIGEGIGGLLP